MGIAEAQRENEKLFTLQTNSPKVDSVVHRILVSEDDIVKFFHFTDENIEAWRE